MWIKQSVLPHSHRQGWSPGGVHAILGSKLPPSTLCESREVWFSTPRSASALGGDHGGRECFSTRIPHSLASFSLHTVLFTGHLSLLLPPILPEHHLLKVASSPFQLTFQRLLDGGYFDLPENLAFSC